MAQPVIEISHLKKTFGQNEVLRDINFSANLGPGTYSVQTALVSTDTHLVNNYEWRDLAIVFNVININGNDLEQIEAACTLARTCKGKPTAVIMKTVKGKGVSFMENKAGWHGKAPNDEEYAVAMGELKAQLAQLEAE